MNIEFMVGSEDGEMESDFVGCVYLHVKVIADGQEEGSLTGWFPVAVAAHIKSALNAQEKR